MKIKFYHISFIIIFLFSSCQPKEKDQEDSEVEKTTETLIENIENDDVEILDIEGCEYIVLKSTPSDHASHAYGFMSHKGNCKNPIHYHNRKILSTDSIK